MKDERIVLKWCFDALDNVIALQRKRWYGWKTVSWIYPSVVESEDCEYIRQWLEQDAIINQKKIRSQKEIGKEIMNKCADKL